MALGGLAAAPARAADPPQRLGGSLVRSLAVAPDGTAHVGMFGFGTGVAPAFAVASAAPGAAFAPPRAVIAPDDADRLAEAGIAASGETVAVALRMRGGHRRVRATIVAPDGSRTPLRTISFNAHSARQAHLAVAPSGEAVAAWLQYDGARWRVGAALRPAGAARFDRPVALSGPVRAAPSSRSRSAAAATRS